MGRWLAVWSIGIVGMLVFVDSALAVDWQAGQPFSTKDYFYNYTHPVAGDYVYRTDKILTPAGEPWPEKDSWSSGLAALFSSDKSRARTQEGLALNLLVQDLGRQLLMHAKEAVVDEYVVTVSTFVNLKHLYRTSSLGRYISEQLISELQHAGLDILEIRKTPMILMSEHFGEYSLSRDMKELEFVHNAQATVVGTYTVSEGRLFLNARLLRNSDGMILSSASRVMNITSVVSGMLADEGMPRKTVGTVAIRNYRESASSFAGNKDKGGPNP